MMKVKTAESPPNHPASTKPIWITNRQSHFKARHLGTTDYELQGFHCQSNGALPILLLHAFCFEILEIHLGQWHHHCSNVKSQPSSTNYPSVTQHSAPRNCAYPSLVQTRIYHNPRRAEIRTFPNCNMLCST